MKLFALICLLAVGALADVQVVEKPHSISIQSDGQTLWTFNHDPAEGKPYFHPLGSTDGTLFTDLRPKDHPWHRGVWFSWKFINGVNYWEEGRATGKSAGETRIVDVARQVGGQAVRLDLALEYAPADSDVLVMKEQRNIRISAPDESGVYTIDWASSFQALENDVVLDRTPLPGEANGKKWGGYAGWSVRMNKNVAGGAFMNSDGLAGESAHRESASWMLFQAPEGGSLLFMDHPDNLRYPAKWYVAEKMPYFSPAAIHDEPHAIKAGESLTLRYRLVVHPGAIRAEAAEQEWSNWVKAKVVILAGANNHRWQETTPVLEEILEGSGKFDVEVVEDPERLTPEFLTDYDVLLSNWNAYGKNKPALWSEVLKKTYVEFVRNGGGHVVVHAGSSSFYDWDDYHAICCATWERGGTAHKKPHEFEVRMKPHPITHGLENFKTTDELWFRPTVHPQAQIVAEAYSKTTGNWEPSAMVSRFGEGRTFCLLLGHDEGSMKQGGFKKLLVAGTAWTAQQ